MTKSDRSSVGRFDTMISGCWILVVMSLISCGLILMATSISSAVDQIILFPTQPVLPARQVKPTMIKIAKPAPVIAKVIEDAVNIRAAPSTQVTVIGKLAKGDQITLVERSQDGKWYRIQSDDETARWVSGEMLEITEGDPGILSTVPSHP